MEKNNNKTLYICNGKVCNIYAKYIAESLQKKLGKQSDIKLEFCLCLGHCEKAPNVVWQGKIMNHSHIDGIIETINKDYKKINNEDT